MIRALTPQMMYERRRTVGLVVLVIAVVLRCALAVPDFFHYPDEVWQYLEPAYGLVHGRSVVTWEYREGIRGWLIPVMFGLPFHLGAWLGLQSHTVVLIIKIVLGLASTVIVYSGAKVAMRLSPLHGLVTGLVLATSLELVFFGVRPLSEAMAADFLMPAAAILTLSPDRWRRSWLVAAGLCLGFAVCFRLHLIPMAGALAVMTLRTNWKAWGAVALGGIVALAISGAADLSQGATPFRWMVNNVMLNVVERRSEAYGTSPPYWYLAEFARLFGVFVIPLAVLIGIGARRVPVLVVIALINIGFHSLVAHKELRFVFPSVPFLLTAAAIGAADAMQWVRGRRVWVATAVLLAVFVGASVSAAISPVGRARFQGRRLLMLWSHIHEEPGLCGVGVYGDIPSPLAHVFIDRPVPLYMFDDRDRDRAFASNRHAANVVIAAEADDAVLQANGYRLKWCATSLRRDFAGVRDHCYYRRPGTCSTGDPRYLANADYARHRR